MVHWLPLLRYIGYAFVAGSSVATVGVVAISLTTSRNIVEARATTTNINSSVQFLSATRWREESAAFRSSRVYRPLSLYQYSFVISEALDGLLRLLLRDYIFSWYGTITKDQKFGNEVDHSIRHALTEIGARAFKEDVVNVTISRIVPIVTAHLKAFDQAERLVRGRSLDRNVTESEELDLAIAGRYRDGKLHSAATLTFSDTKVVQQEYLRKMLVRILPAVLSESMMKSRTVSVLIKEMVACAVLFPVMQTVSDPDTWNQLIGAYGRTALQDRKTVRKLRAALDEHALPASISRQSQDFPILAPDDSERSFERFVRAIRRTNNLSDARRFRSQISSQLKREATVVGQDQLYVRRLATGKRVLDQKIAKLAIKGGLDITLPRNDGPRKDDDARSRESTLAEVMHSSSGLSYFMEYMDRHGQMSSVQFWVVVDGLRDPLEDDFGDEALNNDPSTWSETDRTDIAQISEAYLSKPELGIPEESQSAVKAFLRAGRNATPVQYRQARTAILTAQSAMLEELELRHFPSFKKSDLYYKYLASDEGSKESSRLVRDPAPRIVPAKLNQPQVPAPRMGRTHSQPPYRAKDLRRAAMSSSDIRNTNVRCMTDEEPSTLRRSLETVRPKPLFDDDYDTDPLANSTDSLGFESANGDAASQTRVIESMEAALNDIITEDPKGDGVDKSRDSLLSSPTSSHKSMVTSESLRRSFDFPRIGVVTGDKARPSIATLGLVNTASRIGVFSDNDLFPDEEKFLEDEHADPEPETPSHLSEDDVQKAAPGDLGLTEAILFLNKDIEKLISQDSIVDALTRKAELTNNIAELRILGKSKSSLERELRRKELQRQQYMIQESDNSLYGRARIRIKSVMVGNEEDGREFALYKIEVQRNAGEQMEAATWTVTRRYSEFHDLHYRLRNRYPSTRTLDFPRRRMVMKMQKEFLHKRRLALEEYLRHLLRMPDVCRSREFRSFLSQQAIMWQDEAPTEPQTQDIVSRIYSSVTDGMDDFLGNVVVRDQLSVAGQNLVCAATSQLNTTQTGIIPPLPGSIAEAEAELKAFEDRELEPFVKPICDLFLEIFELNRGNNWLRGRAVVVVLHQLLGGTIERKVREIVKPFTREDSILKYIDLIKETMWPGGKLRVTRPRSTAEKMKSRQEANVVLATLVPDMAANVVGRTNANAAGIRIFTTVNNERLNTHLAFTILDEVVSIIFGSIGREK